MNTRVRALRMLTLVAIAAVVSFSVACSSGPAPVARMQVQATKYDPDFDRTWSALNDVLSEMQLPIRAFEKDSGLVTTDNVSAGSRYVHWGKKDDKGQEISTWALKTRYFLNIRVRKTDDGGTMVDVLPHVEAMLYEYNATLRRTVETGWASCESHGDIEKSIYDALKAKLQR